MPYNIVFNLLEMSYEKTNMFYYIIEEFYKNQNNIYFPKSFNVVKYRKFIELLAEEKKAYIDFDNKENIIKKGKYIKMVEKLPLYLKIFKETFYRKYDMENYIKLSQEKNFLPIIKEQISSKVIKKEDNINIKVINNVIKIMNKQDEIKHLLQLFNSFPEILNCIIDNFDNLKTVIKKINLINIYKVNERDDLNMIKDCHKKILELEKKNNIYFIDFKEIIEKYMDNCSVSNLKKLAIIREMIINQKKYGEELKGFESKKMNIFMKQE